MNHSSNTRGGRKELEFFVIIRYSYYLWSGLVLFSSVPGLAVSAYCKFYGNHYKKILKMCDWYCKKGKNNESYKNAQFKAQKIEKSEQQNQEERIWQQVEKVAKWLLIQLYQ